MGYTTDVHQFTVACKDNLPNKPTRISEERIAFIRKMVNDEMGELEGSKTIAEQADALVDAIYYICDFAATHGINLDPLFEIVHGANMQKIVNGKVIRREDGKILKPEGWQDPGPKLEAEIERQVENGAFSNGTAHS
jgi:predicted HAD superfamily Cof-like phosphohydrolase